MTSEHALKTEKRTKIEDKEEEAGKIFLNMTSTNLLCTSSTLGFHGKPGINYQQYGLFFFIEVHHPCTVIFTFSHRRENALSAKTDIATLLSWLYTYHFSRFVMFVHYFVNYFVRLWTNHYTLLTISPISFIFDSTRNLTRNFPYLLFDVSWKYRLSSENSETWYEKNDWRNGLQNAIYTLIIPLISPTFFHVLVNLTISV